MSRVTRLPAVFLVTALVTLHASVPARAMPLEACAPITLERRVPPPGDPLGTLSPAQQIGLTVVIAGDISLPVP